MSHRGQKYQGPSGDRLTPRISEPARPESRGHTPPRIRPMESKDSLCDYSVLGDDPRDRTIDEIPSPLVEGKNWKAYHMTCETEDEDEDEGIQKTPGPAPAAWPADCEPRTPRSRPLSTSNVPPAASSDLPPTPRQSRMSTPRPSRKATPVVSQFSEDVDWSIPLKESRTLTNASNVLPSCSHWMGSLTEVDYCHSAPVQGWTRGKFSQNHSLASTSAQFDKYNRGPIPIPSEYCNNPSALDIGPTAISGELVPGWWIIGPTDSRFSLRACNTCLPGLRATLPSEYIRFQEKEPCDTRNHKCSFSSMLVRFGWFMMLQKLKCWGSGRSRVENDVDQLIDHTLRLLGSSISSTDPCPGSNPMVGNWYGFPRGFGSSSSKQSGFRLDCLICPQDYHLIKSLFPWTSLVLKKIPTDEALQQPHLCSFRVDSLRWNTLVYTIYKSCYMDGLNPLLPNRGSQKLEFYPGGKEDPWIRRVDNSLCAVLDARMPFDRCYRDDSFFGFSWYTIPSIPYFTVCAHCYATVVLPLRRTGSAIAQAFSARPGWITSDPLPAQRLAAASSPRVSSRSSSQRSGSRRHSRTPSSSPRDQSQADRKVELSCQLYSSRMRAIFTYAAASVAIPVSEARKKRILQEQAAQSTNWSLPGSQMGSAKGYDVYDGSSLEADEQKHAIINVPVHFATNAEAMDYLKARAQARYILEKNTVIQRRELNKDLDAMVASGVSRYDSEWDSKMRKLRQLDIQWRGLE